MPTVDETLDAVRRQVDARLERYLAEVTTHSMRRAPESLPLVEQVRLLTLRGGKRIRAALVVAAAESIGPWEPLGDALVDVCAGIELLQTYLLIHDDWMDGDTLRRGGPTVHVSLGASVGDAHLGAALAVLAGDFASALAQDLVASAPIAPARLPAVLRAFVAMQREVVLGQALDVLDTDDLDRMHDLKTGSYTVRGPLALGHAVAGGDASTWRSLEAFARPLGLAFQLRDDLIGAYGDERETGKTSGTDLRTGKHTAPVRLALERLDPTRRATLAARLTQGTDEAVAEARALMNAVEVVPSVEARIGALCEEALASLDGAAIRPTGRALLVTLAHGMTQRRK